MLPRQKAHPERRELKFIHNIISKIKQTSVAGLLGVGRLASLGASMLVRARILSAGGPFLGGLLMTTAPPSITCFTTPLKYCLGAAGARSAAAGALSVWFSCADIADNHISIKQELQKKLEV